MSNFGDGFVDCMSGKSLIVPDMFNLEEAIKFVGDLKDAWEQSGGSDEILIGALIVSMPFLGEEEAAALQMMAEIAVAVYLAAFVCCLWDTSRSALISLNESGQVPSYLVAMLNDQGVELDSAVA